MYKLYDFYDVWAAIYLCIQSKRMESLCLRLWSFLFFCNNLKLEGQCVVIQYKNVVFDYRR